MLRSWIKRKRSALASPRAEVVVGLEIGRRTVARVELHARGSGWSREEAASHDVSVPLLSGKVEPAHRSALSDALRHLGPDLATRYVPVRVAIPDPAVVITVFELDTLPAGRKAQLELARWMMKKERFAAADDPVCVCQPLGEDAGKHLLLAAAMDRDWHGCLVSALHAAGIVPWSLNAAALYAHNRWHSQWSSLGGGGALIRLDRDSWTLTVWDKRAAPRLVRSRWRERAETELDLISTDVERTILSYIHGGVGREVKAIYASAISDELPLLTAALNARLTSPCIALAPDEGVSARSKSNDLTAPAALLAAVA